jgi:hypothetical protein
MPNPFETPTAAENSETIDVPAETVNNPFDTDNTPAPVTANLPAAGGSFGQLIQQAEFLSKSTIIPTAFQNKPANCFIAVELARRLNVPAMMVMQGLYVVNGRPAWEGKALAAISNASGRFSPIRHKMTGTKGKDDYGCIAYFKELSTGQEIEGPEVTMGMAKGLGWTKNPHWVHGYEYMLRYRAESLLVKTVAPEMMCGLQTRQELEEMQNVTPDGPVPAGETAAERAWRERNEG